uniref:Uncharacterized protein n=1 Tax=Kalanchoe fedtschenkoi TaxID=63787 RepID=A0A7N0TS13_KALFE
MLKPEPLPFALQEKLYQWILTQEEERPRVTPVDILAYLQNAIEEDPPASPRLPPHQHPQVAMQLNNLSAPITVATAVGQGTRSGHLDQQAKNSIFSNSLSTTVCRNLQNLTTEPSYNSSPSLPTGKTNSPNQHSRHDSPPTSNDSTDDMHAD